MTEHVDVLVVGARTLLVDQRREVGYPVQCGEFLPTPAELTTLFECRSAIAEAFDIPSESVLRRTHTMACVAPSGRRFVFPLEGYTVSRRLFDQALARRAERAGAELRHPCGVTRVAGDTAWLAGGESVTARVIIGADGPLSTVARGTGFHLEREMFRMITALVPGDFPPEVELHFGRVAPGGYAWLFPRDGDANVGLGVARIPPGKNLSKLLDDFLRSRGVRSPTVRTRWWVPLGAPPASAVRGCALFVGDAANLVMSTNGGGIPTAMISGRAAGIVAARHVREGAPLTDYDRRLTEELYTPLERADQIKRFGDRFVYHDLLLGIGMRFIGTQGLDAMMRLRWPARLGRRS
jgi:digeranylgeranylglycerophospholipid reductase